MARWDEISRDSLAAAGQLMRTGRYRSSVSRAYYAAFAAVAQALTDRNVDFPRGRSAPSHTKLRQTAKANLLLSKRHKRELLARLNDLYGWRVSADYHPDRSIELAEAKDALIAALNTLNIVGV